MLSSIQTLVADRWCKVMLKQEKQTQRIPMPLKDYRLETPDGIISLKVQLKLKERGRSTFLVGSRHGSSLRSWNTSRKLTC
jgi:hypothetical protein